MQNAKLDLQNANQDLQNANQDLQKANQDLQNANQCLQTATEASLTNDSPRTSTTNQNLDPRCRVANQMRKENNVTIIYSYCLH
jgi:hypothetical protein